MSAQTETETLLGSPTLISEEQIMGDIKVYGADWCSMTKNTLSHLKELNVQFQYINIDKDRQAAKWVAEQNNGREKKPTLDIEGTVISEPSNEELDEVLEEKGLLKQ